MIWKIEDKESEVYLTCPYCETRVYFETPYVFSGKRCPKCDQVLYIPLEYWKKR